MTSQELNNILDLHKKWLNDDHSGKWADLSRANLSDADLSRADLSDADLSRADLFGAYLFRANLSGADLSDADLSRANLSDANLSRANLSDANLSRANLSGADLSDANLFRANLSGADLSRANLFGANLSDATIPELLTAFFVCPDFGAFTAWKKLDDDTIAELLIPAEAKRTSSLIGRKCRAEFAIVVQIHGQQALQGSFDRHTHSIQYKVGKTVYPDSYNDDIRVECAPGIHFFITRAEAEAY